VSYVDARKAVGWNVTISTLPLADGLADPDMILAYNQLIRDNWSGFADEFVDLAADPRLQDHTDTTYFSTDELHLNYTGSGVVAEILDHRYYEMPEQISQGLVYYDAGEVSFFEQQNGESAMMAVGARYSDGTPLEGAVWFDAAGGINRVTFNHLGESLMVDMDGDGIKDLLSVNGTYSDGSPISGAVWYSADAQMNRLSYFEAGDYRVADWNGDGQMNFITNNAYGSGAQVQGAAWYSLDGSVSRLAHYDLGDYRVVDWDGDGNMDILSNMGRYSNGDSLNGMVVVGQDGSLSRLHFYDAGEDYEVLDLNGDGQLEVFSANAKTLSGDALGAVYFDQSGAANRFTFNQLGDYETVDITGDGDIEIVSNGDLYGHGSAIGGTMLYDSDGSASRLNFFNMNEYQVVDFDNDGAMELITGSASYSSGAAVGGLVMFELSGDDTFSFKRLAFGEFNEYHLVDMDQDGWLDVANQTEQSVMVHYGLQADFI